MAKALTCTHCGNEVSAENDDMLVKAIQKHNKEHHDVETSEEEARKAIQERATTKE